MSDTARIAGVVLAGGASSRFGRDKAEELYRGRKLIDWSVEALAPFCETLFVSGRDHSGYKRTVDRPRAGLGPLGGLAGAMHAARAEGLSHILALPCDTPHVDAETLSRLCSVETGAYVASCPVIGFWPVAGLDRLEAHLVVDERRSVRAWAATMGVIAIATDPIANINFVDDITRLSEDGDRLG